MEATGYRRLTADVGYNDHDSRTYKDPDSEDDASVDVALAPEEFDQRVRDLLPENDIKHLPSPIDRILYWRGDFPSSLGGAFVVGARVGRRTGFPVRTICAWSKLSPGVRDAGRERRKVPAGVVDGPHGVLQSASP